jgi:peptidylprolyl isomerase
MTAITRRLAAALCASLLFLAPAGAQDLDPANTLVMELKCGKVLIRLRPDVAPKHVERIKQLAHEGFYDGIIFHRVIEGFMAQTGDPTGTGRGKSSYPNLAAEFSPVPYERGVVGMARASDPDSANSQFFIMFTSYPSLNGKYTVWGEVAQGMDCVDQINRGEPPADPDKILSLRLMSEAQ